MKASELIKLIQEKVDESGIDPEITFYDADASADLVTVYPIPVSLEREDAEGNPCEPYIMIEIEVKDEESSD
jgi:hypothetical protein